jgi:protein ImuA
MQTEKAHILAQLQKEILLLGGHKLPVKNMNLPNALQFMQSHFSQGVFPLGAVHEFVFNNPEAAAATTGFVGGLLSACIPVKGAIVWISRRNNIFPPALSAFNIEPSAIIFIHPTNEKEVLWVMEEVLKCNSITAVVAEMQELNFTNSRRFQLAVEKSKVTGFILNEKQQPANNACISRWQIQSLPSMLQQGLPGVGHTRWQVDLKKIRNGKPGSWQIEWTGNNFNQVLASPSLIQTAPLKKQTA